MGDALQDELRPAVSLPFEYVLWSAKQCAAYFGQSYSQFMHKTRYADGFPQPRDMPGAPRWRALSVTEWAIRS